MLVIFGIFDFDFIGKMQNGEKVETSGLEYVIVHQGKIQHIEICQKARTAS